MRLNPSTEIISKAFITTDVEVLWCSHSTFTLYSTIYYYNSYNYYIIIIIIIIIIVIIIIWKGYFSVNSILSLFSF